MLLWLPSFPLPCADALPLWLHSTAPPPVMFPPIPLVAVDPSDEFECEILCEFEFVDFDFARQFDYGRVFEGGGAWFVGSFESDAVSVEYSDDSSAFHGHLRGQRHRQLCSNRM